MHVLCDDEKRRISRALRQTPGPEVGVLRLLVPAEIDFALKGAAAQVARERLVPRVLAAVRDQIRRLAERFAAHLTLVRFFSCKPTERNALVQKQIQTQLRA